MPSNDSRYPIVPPNGDIVVGAYYDPHLLPDFGGPMFRLVNAKLLQREIVDRRQSDPTLGDTYQFLIDHIRVVAHSEGEMEMPDNVNLGFSTRRSQLAERDETDDALDVLFASKKRKTGELPSASTSQIVETPSTKPKMRKETKTRSGKGKEEATAGSNDEEWNDSSDIAMTEN
ncbi:hypothetical protein F5887DRAFT_920896 [Amanita rubescens]|nr:hypothetical protein F5887DRAFT_920896 [Amanita rubescens]